MENVMADVFLSYSRRDQAFVRQLVAALETHGRAAWVDWEGIPLTADWWQEIRDGIEKADTFVFVTSPNSLQSPICQLELSHALRNNKRLVPLIIAPPDENSAFGVLAARNLDENTRARLEGRDIMALARDNWQAISRHNWVQFDSDAGFEQSFKALVAAIETDLDYVRQHTRLLVRAREWDNKGRNPAFLLHGVDLHLAESWLAAASGKEPQASPLHAAYIFASRANERRTQRFLLSGVSIAFVVALGLALFGFWQSQVAQANERSAVANQILANDNAGTATVAQGAALFSAATARSNAQLANDNAATAVANATRADSLRLAALGNGLLLSARGRAETAALLAIRSLRTMYSAEADSVLMQAYDELYTKRRFSSTGTGMALTSDESFVLTSQGLWNLSTGENRPVFPKDLSDVNKIAISPDGRYAATVSR